MGFPAIFKKILGTSCGYELLVTSCRGHKMLVYRIQHSNGFHERVIFDIATIILQIFFFFCNLEDTVYDTYMYLKYLSLHCKKTID